MVEHLNDISVLLCHAYMSLQCSFYSKNRPFDLKIVQDTLYQLQFSSCDADHSIPRHRQING